MDCIEAEDQYGIKFCDRQKVIIERGQGTEVWDPEGRRYLDFTSGWGVTCLGHSNQVIINALIDQAGKVYRIPVKDSPTRLWRQVVVDCLCRFFLRVWTG